MIVLYRCQIHSPRVQHLLTRTLHSIHSLITFSQPIKYLLSLPHIQQRHRRILSPIIMVMLHQHSSMALIVISIRIHSSYPIFYHHLERRQSICYHTRLPILLLLQQLHLINSHSNHPTLPILIS